MAQVIFDSIADNKIRHRYVKWYTSEETFDRSSLSATLADGDITVKSYATILCVIKPTDEIIVNEVTISDRATALNTIKALAGEASSSGDSSDGNIQYVDVQLTDAQIKNLRAAPVTALVVVAGKMAVVHSIFTRRTIIVAYDFTGDEEITLRYASNTTGDPVDVNGALYIIGKVPHMEAPFNAIFQNHAGSGNLEFWNALGTDFTSGDPDNIIYFRIFYSLIDLADFGGE